jgi:tRNA(Arg) A34 adenosine deaminase TadA
MGSTRPDTKATATDLAFMLDLAKGTAAHLGKPTQTPFGSDIVETTTGKRLLRRLNAVAREFDITSHAEVRALRAATKKLKRLSLRGYTLYTTCEPCPMCMAAALWAGVDRVVFGATIDDAARHCNQIYTYAKDLVKKSDLKCEVVGPVAQDECNAIFEDPRMQAAIRLWKTTSAKKGKTK